MCFATGGIAYDRGYDYVEFRIEVQDAFCTAMCRIHISMPLAPPCYLRIMAADVSKSGRKMMTTQLLIIRWMEFRETSHMRLGNPAC